MNTLQWHETAHIAPPSGQVVLGWWDHFTIQTVVHQLKPHRWNTPGYQYSEDRTEPLFWAVLPESPLPPVSDDYTE